MERKSKNEGTQVHVRGLVSDSDGKETACKAGTWAQSLDQKDRLEKGTAATPVRRIPWTEEPGGLQSMGSQRVNMTERLT